MHGADTFAVSTTVRKTMMRGEMFSSMSSLNVASGIQRSTNQSFSRNAFRTQAGSIQYYSWNGSMRRPRCIACWEFGESVAEPT